MSESQGSNTFELRFEGMSADDADSLRKVKTLMLTDCGMEISDIQEVLEAGEGTVLQTSDRKRAKKLELAFSAAGARVEVLGGESDNGQTDETSGSESEPVIEANEEPAEDFDLTISFGGAAGDASELTQEDEPLTEEAAAADTEVVAAQEEASEIEAASEPESGASWDLDLGFGGGVDLSGGSDDDDEDAPKAAAVHAGVEDYLGTDDSEEPEDSDNAPEVESADESGGDDFSLDLSFGDDLGEGDSLAQSSPAAASVEESTSEPDLSEPDSEPEVESSTSSGDDFDLSFASGDVSESATDAPVTEAPAPSLTSEGVPDEPLFDLADSMDTPGGGREKVKVDDQHVIQPSGEESDFDLSLDMGGDDSSPGGSLGGGSTSSKPAPLLGGEPEDTEDDDDFGLSLSSSAGQVDDFEDDDDTEDSFDLSAPEESSSDIEEGDLAEHIRSQLSDDDDDDDEDYDEDDDDEGDELQMDGEESDEEDDDSEEDLDEEDEESESSAPKLSLAAAAGKREASQKDESAVEDKKEDTVKKAEVAPEIEEVETTVSSHGPSQLFGLPSESVLAFIGGLIVLGVMNYFFFLTPDNRNDELLKKQMMGVLSRSASEIASLKKLKTADANLQVSLEKKTGNFVAQGTFERELFTVAVELSGKKGKLTEMKFGVSMDPSPQLTPEEVVTNKERLPWITGVKFEDFKFEEMEEGVFEARSRGKGVFVKKGNLRGRVLAAALIVATLDMDAQKVTLDVDAGRNITALKGSEYPAVVEKDGGVAFRFKDTLVVPLAAPTELADDGKKEGEGESDKQEVDSAKKPVKKVSKKKRRKRK